MKVFAHVITKNKHDLFARTIFSNHACPAEHVMAFLIESRYGKTSGILTLENRDGNVQMRMFLGLIFQM